MDNRASRRAAERADPRVNLDLAVDLAKPVVRLTVNSVTAFVRHLDEDGAVLPERVEKGPDGQDAYGWARSQYMAADELLAAIQKVVREEITLALPAMVASAVSRGITDHGEEKCDCGTSRQAHIHLGHAFTTLGQPSQGGQGFGGWKPREQQIIHEAARVARED